jgi:hypothetical protein
LHEVSNEKQKQQENWKSPSEYLLGGTDWIKAVMQMEYRCCLGLPTKPCMTDVKIIYNTAGGQMPSTTLHRGWVVWFHFYGHTIFVWSLEVWNVSSHQLLARVYI